MIEVAAGVVVDPKTRRMLLTQRPVGKDFAFLWETPGGKIEPGELGPEALRRELEEELGIQVEEIAESAVWSGTIDLNSKPSIFLVFYRVLSWKGTPTPREGQGFGWFSKAELLNLGMCPGNVKALGVLADLVEKSR